MAVKPVSSGHFKCFMFYSSILHVFATAWKGKKSEFTFSHRCVSAECQQLVLTVKLPLFAPGCTLADNWKFTPPTFLVLSLSQSLAAMLVTLAASITTPQHVPGRLSWMFSTLNIIDCWCHSKETEPGGNLNLGGKGNLIFNLLPCEENIMFTSALKLHNNVISHSWLTLYCFSSKFLLPSVARFSKHPNDSIWVFALWVTLAVGPAVCAFVCVYKCGGTEGVDMPPLECLRVWQCLEWLWSLTPFRKGA